MNVFVDFFLNIFNLLIAVIFLIGGVILGILFRPRGRSHVTKLIPRDKRFIDFDILKETAVSVICKAKKGFPPQRFFKFRSGFTGNTGRFLKRIVTRYLGLEGTAYTWRIESGQDIPIGTLGEALKNLWGEPFYDAIPKKQKDLVEESKIGVTVDLAEEPLTPDGFRKLTEEDIKQEEDRQAVETFWKGKHVADKTKIIEYIFIAGTGFAIACVLFLIGILKVGSPTIQNPPTEAVSPAIGMIGAIIKGRLWKD